MVIYKINTLVTIMNRLVFKVNALVRVNTVVSKVYTLVAKEVHTRCAEYCSDINIVFINDVVALGDQIV